MANKKRDAHPSETVMYNVALAVFLADKIKGPTNVVASVLLADIHQYTRFQQTTKRGYAALSAQHAEKLHPEYGLNTIKSALQLLEKTGLVTVVKPEKNDRLENGQRPASEYKLTKLAYQFVSKTDGDEEAPKEEAKAEKKEVDNSYAEQIREVVEHLNTVTGKRFKAGTSATDKHIRARLKEGFTVDDLINVIDAKYAEWNGQMWNVNGNMKHATDYIRPQTLFSDKFQTYLNEIPVKNMQENFVSNDNLTDAEIYSRFWKYGVLEDGSFGFGIEIHEEKLNMCKIPDASMARAKELLEKEKNN